MENKEIKETAHSHILLAGTRLSMFSLRLTDVLSRSMVTPFFNCISLRKMSLESHSSVSLLRAEPLTTLPTVAIIFCITTFSIVGFQLRQFLKAEHHRHLVASSRADKAVYLVEVERGQLVHDDANGNVLALPRVYAGDETVEVMGVQRPDDAIHLKVIGDKQIAWVPRVADLQVEIIPVLVKYPVALLRRQSGRIDV